MSGIVTQTAGGHETLCGGTRTEPKIERPWQKQLAFPARREDCPLCSKAQLEEEYPLPGWKTFKNSNTPFPYHRILIPAECWPDEKLRSLGGPDMIALAIRLVLEDFMKSLEIRDQMWVYTHVGYGAGQNFPHLHWHLCEAPAKPKSLERTNAVELFESESFRTVLVGVRAGQTAIVPKDERVSYFDLLHDSALRTEFAAEAHRVVDSFNRKFRFPDYCLFFGFNESGNWHARYTPILNNWGGSEFAALDYGTPFVLPWPHEETARFLLD